MRVSRRLSCATHGMPPLGRVRRVQRAGHVRFDRNHAPHYTGWRMVKKPPILVLLLIVAIAALPMHSRLMGSPMPKDGASHAHSHTHDGHQHFHHHQHSDGEKDGVASGEDHHSTRGHVSDGSVSARTALRRVEGAMSALTPVMTGLTAPLAGVWPQDRRATLPPWWLIGRSCQTTQLQTIVLLV